MEVDNSYSPNSTTHDITTQGQYVYINSRYLDFLNIQWTYLLLNISGVKSCDQNKNTTTYLHTCKYLKRSKYLKMKSGLSVSSSTERLYNVLSYLDISEKNQDFGIF